MGLFNKFIKKEKDDWKSAYMGNPNFYKGKDGKPFGAFALTENTLTSLPKNPKALYNFLKSKKINLKFKVKKFSN